MLLEEVLAEEPDEYFLEGVFFAEQLLRTIEPEEGECIWFRELRRSDFRKGQLYQGDGKSFTHQKSILCRDCHSAKVFELTPYRYGVTNQFYFKRMFKLLNNFSASPLDVIRIFRFKNGGEDNHIIVHKRAECNIWKVPFPKPYIGLPDAVYPVRFIWRLFAEGSFQPNTTEAISWLDELITHLQIAGQFSVFKANMRNLWKLLVDPEIDRKSVAVKTAYVFSEKLWTPSPEVFLFVLNTQDYPCGLVSQFLTEFLIAFRDFKNTSELATFIHELDLGENLHLFFPSSGYPFSTRLAEIPDKTSEKFIRRLIRREKRIYHIREKVNELINADRTLDEVEEKARKLCFLDRVKKHSSKPEKSHEDIVWETMIDWDQTPERVNEEDYKKLKVKFLGRLNKHVLDPGKALVDIVLDKMQVSLQDYEEALERGIAEENEEK